MDGALASAAGEPAKSAVVHLEREFGYLVHFRRNIVNLGNMVEQLSAATTDVQNLVNAAERDNRLVRETVRNWMRRAETSKEEATQLIAEAGGINSWFKGWCCSRFSLGRKAEKRNAVIKGLLDDRIIIGDTVSDPKPYQCLELVSAGDFEAFTSRRSITEQLIKSLSDEQAGLVGVFGMPGVGKTVLVQAIAKQAKEKQFIDEVVMVIVSPNPALERIQAEIAKALDLKLHEGDTSGTRASQLSYRLSRGKKILIILDDVWERLELVAGVGIPFRNNNSGCKVIFTTRHEGVCKQMEPHKKIEVAVLSEEDSRTLFYKKAISGTNFVISDEISRGIVDQCKGLPLAIVTLGLTLRSYNSELEWEVALAQLKKSVFEGMGPVVSSIKLSYESLQNTAAELCFLFCCLFPEDFRIRLNVLLSYVIGEDLLKDVETLAEARGMLQLIVGKLLSSNLLLKDENGKLKMHDVIRDVALSIASEDDMLGFFVRAGMQLIQWPNKEVSTCKRISVMHNRINFNAPYQIKAQHLLTLCMRYNSSLTKFPDNFFDDMENLLTLDLSSTGIRTLPSSLSCLVKLRTLLLERCVLDSISPVEKLESLVILSFRRSKVKRWPEEIGKLSSMRLLELSYSRWGERIPPKVIASMLQLEELSMLHDFPTNPSGAKLEIMGGVTEISSSTHLTSLEVHVKNLVCLSEEIPNWENLRKFKLYFSGEMNNRLSLREAEESRQLQNIMYLEIPSNSVGNWVKVLVAKTNCLYLSYCSNLENVAELDKKGLNALKFLSINHCKGVRHLMNTAVVNSQIAFRNLEVLKIYGVDSFEGFCSGMLPEGFLCKLRVLKLRGCRTIINFMRADLSARLQNLEHLQIRKCTRLEKLIQFEEREEVVEDHVATHTMLNKSGINKFSSWTPSQIFPNLKIMMLYGCGEVKYVFSLSVARNLLHLTELTLRSCAKINTIIENDSGEEARNIAEKHKLELPLLKKLCLHTLPELSTFSPLGLIIDCPLLEDLTLRACGKLVRLPFGSKSIPEIQVLRAERELFDKLEWVEEGPKSRLSEVLDEIRG